jgi:hypothetical protein
MECLQKYWVFPAASISEILMVCVTSRLLRGIYVPECCVLLVGKSSVSVGMSVFLLGISGLLCGVGDM